MRRSDNHLTPEAHASDHTYDVLDDLMARIGVDGLTAALVHPGLLAEVDQHAAAIREAVRRSGRQVTADTVVSYATSVTAAVRRCGVTLPEPGDAAPQHLDWLRADWFLLRLTAVCAIAESNGWL